LKLFKPRLKLIPGAPGSQFVLSPVLTDSMMTALPVGYFTPCKMRFVPTARANANRRQAANIQLSMKLPTERV